MIKKLSAAEAAAALAAPNGSEKLAARPEFCYDAVFELFKEGSPQAAAFLCRIARQKQWNERIAADIGSGFELLATAIASDEPKLRKNAARLSGELKAVPCVPALIAALNAEEHRFVIASQILALGAIGTDEATDAALAYKPRPAETPADERHIADINAAIASVKSANRAFEAHVFTGLDHVYEVELRTPDMLSDSLTSELASIGIKPVKTFSNAVRIQTQDIPALYKLRCFFEILFPAGQCMADAKNIAICAKPYMERLLFGSHSGSGAFPYRIELKGDGIDRAKLSHTMAAVLDGGRLTNSTSAYQAELRVEISRAQARVYVKLFTIPDTRFDYRVSSLPASIHPVTAAAVIRYAGAYMHQGARVLDPCCGSGTMLIERDRFLACEALTGVDIAHKAIDIARENTAAADCPARYIVNDCRRFSANRPYDEVISNLPFGNRVGSHDDNETLYAAILDGLSKWLKKDGVAVLYTMEFTLLKKLVQKRPKLKLISEAKTEAGGLYPGIFIIKIS